MKQKGGTHTDTLVKLVLVFFISLLSFSVGTFVGKQFSDSQNRLAAIDRTMDRDTASVVPDGDNSQHQDELTNADLNKLSNEFSKKSGADDDVAQALSKSTAKLDHAHEPSIRIVHVHRFPASAKMKTHHAILAQKNKMHRLQNAAKRIAEGKTPDVQPAAKASAKKAQFMPSTVAASTAGKYTIQVASYQQKSDAEKYAEQLRAKGFNAYTVAAQVRGATWYRVSVGLFTTFKDAMHARNGLANKPDLKAAIVQRIQE